MATPDCTVGTFFPGRGRGRPGTVSKRFGEKVRNVWLTDIEWGIALSPDVHGLLSTELPDGGGEPSKGLATGHPFLGMWITN